MAPRKTAPRTKELGSTAVKGRPGKVKKTTKTPFPKTKTLPPNYQNHGDRRENAITILESDGSRFDPLTITSRDEGCPQPARPADAAANPTAGPIAHEDRPLPARPATPAPPNRNPPAQRQSVSPLFFREVEPPAPAPRPPPLFPPSRTSLTNQTAAPRPVSSGADILARIRRALAAAQVAAGAVGDLGGAEVEVGWARGRVAGLESLLNSIEEM